MRAFLSSVVDVALVVLVAEMLVLIALRGRSWAIRPLDLLGQLLSGATLLLALRCSIRGADPAWTLAFLSASLPAHVYDVARRARQRHDGRQYTRAV
jgi:hypothetical protein